MPVSVKVEDPRFYKTLIERTSDDQSSTRAILILDGLDSNVKRVNPVPNCLVRQGGDAELLQRIVGIRDEFTEEDISMRVQAG